MQNTLDFTKICSADDLRKAEILIYSKGSQIVSRIEGINFLQTLQPITITASHNMSDNNQNKTTKK